MPRRPKASIGEDDYNSQEPWVWGNHRGGGGAPLKDDMGNTVANLKGAVPHLQYDDNHASNRRMASPPNYRRRTEEEDDYVPSFNRGGGRGAAAGYDRSPPKRRGLVEDSNYGERQHSPTHAGSPQKKFMSALKDMHENQSTQEKNAKYMRELEYQNALRAQIEEKQRKKDEEKRKEEEIKRREYEEYLRAVNPQALEKNKRIDANVSSLNVPNKKSIRMPKDDANSGGGY
eukprot:gene40075-48835_t